MAEISEKQNQQIHHILSSVFGFSNFRGQQFEVISALLNGDDVFAIMPTGAGKSLCFQVPALAMSGFALVVCPLIALMEDQVSGLEQFGVRALSINSSMSFAEISKNFQLMRAGLCDVVYVSPERLLQESFIDLLTNCKIALFAIDEAHCVSQWGHDFRPEYLKLAHIFHQFPDVPKIALTATADKPTRKDIIEKLNLANAKNFVSSFDRPNIKYEIGVKNNYRKQLLAFLDGQVGNSGIIYCMSKKKVDELTLFLQQQGLNAISYHAGLAAGTRKKNQRRFLLEEDAIMVATIAFGMGIDKPNVRFVVHVDLPRNIESYYQETGRAGRDGLPSKAVLFYGLQDIIMQRSMINESGALQNQKNIEIGKLNAMIALCETVSCRRHALLSYFDEPEFENEKCGNCDICENAPEVFNARIQVEKMISAIYRTDQMFGMNYVIDVLLGKENDRIKSFAHHKISVYGIGKEHSAGEWQMIVRQMIIKNLLMVDAEHKSLKLTKLAREFLKNGEAIFMRKDVEIEQKKKVASSIKQEKEKMLGMMSLADQEMLKELKKMRSQIAARQAVPPYIIFHDTSLIEMAIRRPKNMDEMSMISGIGEKKLKEYGESFLELIKFALV